MQGRRDLPVAPDPRVGFEMTLLKMMAFRPPAAGGGAQARRREPTPDSAEPEPAPAATASAGAVGMQPTPTPAPSTHLTAPHLPAAVHLLGAASDKTN